MNTKTNNIYLSTGAFKTSNLAEILEVCEVLDFHNLELSSGLPWSERLTDDIKSASMSCNLLVHNYFPPPRVPFVLNLAAKNAQVLKLSLEHCQGAIDLCSEVNSPFYSVHSGFAFDVDASMLGKNLSSAARYPLEEANKIFIESLQSLCEYGTKRNVRVAIENNVVAPMNLIDGKNLLLLGATAEELLEIHEKVKSESFGFLIDVGHLKVTAYALRFDKEQFLRQVKDHIIAFHLNDNDCQSDSNQVFDEQAWFISELHHYPDHPKVIESYRLEIEQLKKLITLVQSI